MELDSNVMMFRPFETIPNVVDAFSFDYRKYEKDELNLSHVNQEVEKTFDYEDDLEDRRGAKKQRRSFEPFIENKEPQDRFNNIQNLSFFGGLNNNKPTSQQTNDNNNNDNTTKSKRKREETIANQQQLKDESSMIINNNTSILTHFNPTVNSYNNKQYKNLNDDNLEASKKKSSVNQKIGTKDLSLSQKTAYLRFGNDSQLKLKVKIVNKETFGVMVQLLEAGDQPGLEVGKRFWAKWSGAVESLMTARTHVPGIILEAIHPC